MNFDDRTEQLSYSAAMQYQHPPQDWKEAIKVEPGQSSLHDQVKYHFKMCYDLSLHLTLAEEDSPIWTTLNYLFNFALLELRLAEFKYVYYLLKATLIGFKMEEHSYLFLLAQALYRCRERLVKEHRDLKLDSGLFTKGDHPYNHHSSKELVKTIFKSIDFFAQQLEPGLLVFKGVEHKLDKNFWDHLACQLGFTIHLMNRVLVLSPSVCDIDE